MGLFGRKDEGEYNPSPAEIINALCEYSAVYLIEVETRKVGFLQIGNRIESHMHDAYQELHEMEWYANVYAERMLFPEQRPEFVATVTTENIVRHLQDKDVYEYVYIGNKDGAPNYFKMTAKSVNNGSHLIVGFADVDKEIRREQKEKELLENTIERVEKANETKLALLRNVSHELNTPLNAIVGFSLIAEKNSSDADIVRESVKKISAAANQLTALVSNMLDMSDAETNDAIVDNKLCDIVELVENIADFYKGPAGDRNVYLTTDTLGVMNREVYLDRNRLHRIISNLIGNAITYSKDNGFVRLSLREKANQSTKNRICYEIEVEDNGIGISEEYLERIYEMFSREKTSTENGISGLGLGLSIVKRNLDILNGTITISSRKDIGTKCTVNVSFKKTED